MVNQFISLLFIEQSPINACIFNQNMNSFFLSILLNLVFILNLALIEYFVERYISKAMILSGIKSKKNINILSIISRIYTTSFQF
jgi:hypothetical protein